MKVRTYYYATLEEQDFIGALSGSTKWCPIAKMVKRILPGHQVSVACGATTIDGQILLNPPKTKAIIVGFDMYGYDYPGETVLFEEVE